MEKLKIYKEEKDILIIMSTLKMITRYGLSQKFVGSTSQISRKPRKSLRKRKKIIKPVVKKRIVKKMKLIKKMKMGELRTYNLIKNYSEEEMKFALYLQEKQKKYIISNPDEIIWEYAKLKGEPIPKYEKMIKKLKNGGFVFKRKGGPYEMQDFKETVAKHYTNITYIPTNLATFSFFINIKPLTKVGPENKNIIKQLTAKKMISTRTVGSETFILLTALGLQNQKAHLKLSNILNKDFTNQFYDINVNSSFVDNIYSITYQRTAKNEFWNPGKSSLAFDYCLSDKKVRTVWNSLKSDDRVLTYKNGGYFLDADKLV